MSVYNLVIAELYLRLMVLGITWSENADTTGDELTTPLNSASGHFSVITRRADGVASS